MLDINKVYNGDSDLILKNIDSESIDLVVTHGIMINSKKLPMNCVEY